MTSTRLFRFAFSALFTVLGTTVLSATGTTEPIPTDPQLTAGILDNGLSYYVLENDQPRDMAELRLVVDAGSILEEEDQRGLAHFLEHMAFNGTDKYPKNELIATLQSFGIEFGPEVNAYTSFDETVYMLSVPLNGEGLLETAMEVLEQWAFHMTLDQQDIVDERGVVYEEYRLSRGASGRIRDQLLPELFQGSRYAERLPIGLPEVIQTASREPLQRFYDQWYRPELMAVIAVGDFETERVVDLIHQYFGDEQGRSSQPRPSYGNPSTPGTRFFSMVDPEANGTSIELYTGVPAEPSLDIDDFRSELIASMAYDLLNERLNRRLESVQPPYILAAAYGSELTRGYQLQSLSAQVGSAGVNAALRAMVEEVERVRQNGFTETEVARAKNGMIRLYRRLNNERDSLNSSAFVDGIQESFLRGTAYSPISWEFEKVQQLVPAIDGEELHRWMKENLSSDNRLVVLTGPEGSEVEQFTDEQALQAIERVEAMALSQIDEDQGAQSLVAQLPTPGVVVEESFIEGPEVIRWVLSNGATVYLKPTDFRQDQILMSASSTGGASLYDYDKYLALSFAATAAQLGGLGEFSQLQLEQFLSDKQVSLSTSIDSYSESMSGQSSVEDLEIMLQMAYLHFTAPGRDPVQWQSFVQRLAPYLESQRNSPQFQLQEQVTKSLYDDHPWSIPLDSEALAALDLDELLDIYRERFSAANDFNFFFTGSFDPEALKPLVELWIGSLEPAAGTEEARDVGFSMAARERTDILRSGIDPISITLLGAGIQDFQWNQEDAYLANSLAELLNILLIEEIREKQGGTYSIGAFANIEKQPTENLSFIIQYSSDPGRVDQLNSSIGNVVEQLVSQGIDPNYIERIQQIQLVNFREGQQDNSWWLAQMENVVTSELSWDFILAGPERYSSLTADRLHSALTDWSDKLNLVQITLLPAE